MSGYVVQLHIFNRILYEDSPDNFCMYGANIVICANNIKQASSLDSSLYICIR
uniref:Uncharacterized protein n=1 Tax=Rhizophora mucronata TaxID=61149 RepID=A0A2P2QZF5_RHIMU